MNTLEKLNVLTASCCSVYLESNAHRDCYQTIEAHFEERQSYAANLYDRSAVSPEEWSRMLAADTLVTLQVYPNTPIGFEFWYGESIESVVDQAWEKLAEHCNTKEMGA